MIKLFERYGHLLDHETSGESIAAEVDFIESVIGFDQTKLILDLGAGACRRSLELARRGYLVVGFSLCEASLEEARKRAEAEQLSAQFVRGDARALVYKTQFDLALLLGERELDRGILKNVFRALKPGGILILTAPKRLAHSSNGFRPCPRPMNSETIDSAGTGKLFSCTHRYCSRAELAERLCDLGFVGIEFFAVAKSGFRCDVPPVDDDHEIGVIAVKDSFAHPHR